MANEKLHPGDRILYQTEPAMTKPEPAEVLEVADLTIRIRNLIHNDERTVLPATTWWTLVARRQTAVTVDQGAKAHGNRKQAVRCRVCGQPAAAETKPPYCEAHRTVTCEVCGRSAPRRRRIQVLCGDPECRLKRDAELARATYLRRLGKAPEPPARPACNAVPEHTPAVLEPLPDAAPCDLLESRLHLYREHAKILGAAAEQLSEAAAGEALNAARIYTRCADDIERDLEGLPSVARARRAFVNAFAENHDFHRSYVDNVACLLMDRLPNLRKDKDRRDSIARDVILKLFC